MSTLQQVGGLTVDSEVSAPAAHMPAADRLTTLPKPATAIDVRSRLLDMLRRDLVGPHPDFDPDLEREVLSGTSPSNWYLTGYLGPRRLDQRARRAKVVTGEATEEDEAEFQLGSLRSSEGMEQGVTGPAN